MLCSELSDKFGVSTDTVMRITGNDACLFSTPICLPYSCTLETITSIGNTLSMKTGSAMKLKYFKPNRINNSQNLADSNSTTERPVTLQMLLTWNPSILGDCAKLDFLQRVCKE